MEDIPNQVLDFLVHDTKPISKPIKELRCSDVDGDGFQEVVGVSLDNKEIWVLDFYGNDLHIPLARSGFIYLGGLLDYDKDGYKDILYTVVSPDSKVTYCVYSVKKQINLFQLEKPADLEIETGITILDFDYDGNQELLACENSKSRQLSSLVLYDVNTGDQEDSLTFSGQISPSSFAIAHDDFYEETRLYFSITPYIEGSAGLNASVQGYYLAVGIHQFEPLWSRTFIEGMLPARLGLGETIDGEETIVVGSRLAKDTASKPRAILELNSIDGQVIHEMSLGDVDCVDLSICELDTDVEKEIVVLGSDHNFRKINFSTNSNRIVTVLQSSMFVGSADIDWTSDLPEMAVILEREGKQSIFFLSSDIDLLGLAEQHKVDGKIVDRPILGDIDGNGKGDVIFISDDGEALLNRMYFFDMLSVTPTPMPVSPTPTPFSPTPTLTPTPIPPRPTPTPIPPRVQEWFSYQ